MSKELAQLIKESSTHKGAVEASMMNYGGLLDIDKIENGYAVKFRKDIPREVILLNIYQGNDHFAISLIFH